MKRVLIISPYFPPFNAADMQRVRMSLPYFREFGWEVEVVAVSPDYLDINQDILLCESIPKDTKVHYVKAFSKKWTSKLGLGSLALRSLVFYHRKVQRLLQTKKFDLIYFSTTQFPVCVLGAYWKKKFHIPYVIDMQDPWHSNYYMSRPKSERPPKYWFSYRLNKWLEPVAMKEVSGLLAVSDSYLKALSERYHNCRNIPMKTITFGAFEPDFMIAAQNVDIQPSVLPNDTKIKVVYVGRGGKDMHDAVTYLLTAFQQCLQQNFAVFSQFHFYFIGTSYASRGTGVPTILPVAKSIGAEAYVTEITDRIPFYQTLNTLKDASALFVPGSNDPQYTASKIYPYVLAQKPLFAIFHPSSSVVPFLRACKVGDVVTFDQSKVDIMRSVCKFLYSLTNKYDLELVPDFNVLEQYSARMMTKEQCNLFDEALKTR